MSYNNFNNWIEIFKIKSLSIQRTPMLFFILFLSFCLRVIRKGLRKNSEIFVNLRRSSGQSMRERSDHWPEFLLFKSVPGCIEGISGHYGMFGGIMGCSRGVPGLFRAVPGCSGGVPGVFRGVPGVFRGVPGCSGVFRVCSGFYRHPFLIHRYYYNIDRSQALVFGPCTLPPISPLRKLLNQDYK